jgi:hypothetical protein
LKRRLKPAITDLENVGFLKRLPEEERFRQVRRGHWEVTFIGERKAKGEKAVRSSSDPLEAGLVDRGVREPVAADLVRTHSTATIRKCLGQFDELRRRGRDSNLNNPAGLLISWIRNSRDVPNDSARSQGSPTRPENAEHDATQIPRQVEVLREYLAKLSPEEMEVLEAEAMKDATLIQRTGYQRAESAGNGRLLADYRKVIMESHVLRLLDSSKI